ncbi:MAG TPA: hypothetical protein VLG47_06990 [Candidatus Saccharimonadales bacterium]|nr:hypothetical protein [Candidatus Saccharimonadales bacterium]
MQTELLNGIPATPITASTEVTFHLAPAETDKPFRRVAGISANETNWRDGYVDQGIALEEYTTTLPTELSDRMLAFARRHIGPEATDKQTRYWCHTLAHRVGHTAMASSAPVNEGEGFRAYQQAESIYQNGARISPNELAVGEHGVVADSDTNRPETRGPIDHSMVGIGDGLAIQVDNEGPHSEFSGHLYIGRPDEYVKRLEAKRGVGETTAQVGFYVHRDPVSDPATPQRRSRTLRNGLRSRLMPQRKP